MEMTFYHQGPDGTPTSTYYSNHHQIAVDQEMFRNEQGTSTDATAFDWFTAGMEYSSADSPEAAQHVAAASVASSNPMGGMLQPGVMQGRPDVQQQQQSLPHPLFMGAAGNMMPPFMNYDSMGLMPAGAHHLPQPPLQQQQQLFTGGHQLFPACSAQVGGASASSSLSSTFLPFDSMLVGGQLPLIHHPSTSMAVHHQQQQHLHMAQHLHQPQQAAAAAAAAALHPYSASASDSSSQITTVLMAFRQGGEETEFVRKAIESLVKKLKDKRLELEALIQAVTSNGKTPTGCVTIQRSLDGRLQVAGRKGVPHVVYARIWRWPNVAKTELAKLPICQIAHDNQDFICINPYHYERVVSNAGMIADERKRTAAGSPGVIYSISGFDNRDEWAAAQMPPNAPSSIPSDTRLAQPQQQAMLQQQHGDLPEFRSSIFPAEVALMGNRLRSVGLSRVQIPSAPHYPPYWCTIQYFEHDTQFGEAFKVRREMMSLTVDGGLDPQGERNGRFCIGAIPNVHRAAPVEIVRMHIGPGVVLKQHPEGRVTMEVRSNKAIFVRAPYVDYVNHSPYGQTTHKFQKGEGEITIFDLRWAYYEMCEQTTSAKEAVVAQARAVAGLPVSHHGMQQMSDVVAGSGVDEMKRMFCTVGMSFVKGFGGAYNRKSLKECPCWIEVELHRPLQLLDQLLKRM